MTKLIPTTLMIGVILLLTGCDKHQSADSTVDGWLNGPSTTSTTVNTTTTSTTVRQSGSGNYKVPARELNTTRTTLDYRADNEGCVDHEAGDPEPDAFEEFCN